jgi:hypothetical protein
VRYHRLYVKFRDSELYLFFLVGKIQFGSHRFSFPENSGFSGDIGKLR